MSNLAELRDSLRDANDEILDLEGAYAEATEERDSLRAQLSACRAALAEATRVLEDHEHSDKRIGPLVDELRKLGAKP